MVGEVVPVRRGGDVAYQRKDISLFAGRKWSIVFLPIKGVLVAFFLVVLLIHKVIKRCFG
jgi:hypothetical protein